MPVKLIRPATKEDLLRFKKNDRPYLSKEEIEQEIQGIEADPWIDPVSAIGAGVGTAGTRAFRAGKKLGPTLIRGIVGGAGAGITEMPAHGCLEIYIQWPGSG